MPHSSAHPTRLHRLIPVLLLPLATACDGGSIGEPENAHFTVSAPAAMNVSRHAGGTGTVHVNRSASFTAPVTLTAALATGQPLPAGWSATFAPNPVTGASALMTLMAGEEVPTGPFPNIVVRGTSGSLARVSAALEAVVLPAQAFTLQFPSREMVAARGGYDEMLVLVLRNGGFTAPVSFTVEGLPEGITATFTPGGASGGSMMFRATVSETAAIGSYPFTITGSAAGVADQRVYGSLRIQLPPAVTLGAVDDVTLASGNVGAITAVVTRSVGYTAPVLLAVTRSDGQPLPAGMTATIPPNSSTAAITHIRIGTTTATPPGVYSLHLTVSGSGIPTYASAFTLTVVPNVGNVVWSSCAPVFLAYRDGSAGNYQQVLPNGNGSFTLGITQGVGSVAIAHSEIIQDWYYGDWEIPVTTVYHRTLAELQALATNACPQIPSDPVRTLHGAVANMLADQSVTIAIGGSTAMATASNPLFSVSSVRPGAVDLLAWLHPTTSSTIERMILRRGITASHGTVLPVLDFTGSEPFTPIAATYTVTNAGIGSVSLSQYHRTNAGPNLIHSMSGVGSLPVFGIPETHWQPGDLYELRASTGDGPSHREVRMFSANLIDRTIAFGPPLNTSVTFPVVDGHLLPMATGAWQAEYDALVTARYLQGTTVTVSASRNYYGGAAAHFEVSHPNLAVFSDYSFSRQLLPSASVYWTVTAEGGSNAPVAGNLYRRAVQNGNRPPGSAAVSAGVRR